MTPDMFSNDEFSKYCNTDIGKRAVEYDRKNSRIWPLFIQYATAAKRKGYKRFSANAIFERIRWELNIESTGTAGQDFKIGNNMRAYYSRKLMTMVGFENFFEIRDFGGRVPLS